MIMSENNVDDKNYLEKGKAFFKKLLSMPIDRIVSILSLLVAIFAVYYTISSTNESQKSATIIRLSEDFSKIGTMNNERISALSMGIQRSLSPKEYQRTLQINYAIYSKFIEKELGYSEFSKFNEISEDLSDSNVNNTKQIETLKKLNTEIDKLYDKVIESYR